MSVQRRTAQGPPDLDSTAELPVLDVAAYETTQENEGAAPVDSPTPEQQRPAVLEEDSTRPQRSRLEEDLKQLSAHLREVEERLASQGPGASALERQIESLRGAQAAAEQRAESVARELADARGALTAAEAQVSELMQLLEAREATLHSRQVQDGTLEAKLAERERALERSERQLDDTRLQAFAQLEALQTREGRRGVYEALLHDLDREVNQRQTRLIELQRGLDSGSQQTLALGEELSGARRHADELASRLGSLESALARKDEELAALKRGLEAAQEDRRHELEAAHDDGQRRITALEAEVADLNGKLAERASASTQAEAQHTARVAQLQADARRVPELEGRLQDYAKAALALQGELGESRERMQAAESDLRAAEDAILRLEGEVRAKNARIEELAKLNDDWRATLEAARRSIHERDALIRRLEAEAAHSTALLDNIQHSIRSIGAAPAGPAGIDEAAAASAIRLLVRTEGESEIVHVLGRKTTIGRTPDNDVQIDTKFVSRHHAVVLSGPVHTIIEDLNSTNGLAVNGERVTRQNLKDGDAIIIGNAQFRYAVRPASERRSV